MYHSGTHTCQPIIREPLCKEAKVALHQNSHLSPRELQWQVGNTALAEFIAKKKSWEETCKTIQGVTDLRKLSNEKQKVQ